MLSYHRECCVKRETFKRTVETPGLDIRDQLHQEPIRIKHINRNRLVPITETILFLGRQELAFRGHRGESGELTIEEPNNNNDTLVLGSITSKSGRYRFEKPSVVLWSENKVFKYNDPKRVNQYYWFSDN